MPAPSTSTTDHDVLKNQYAIAHAQLQAAIRTVAGAGAGSDDSDSSEDEAQQLLRLKPRSSENYGIGFQPSPSAADTDGLASRQESAATQRLRQQLLGRNARPPAGAAVGGGMVRSGHGHVAAKPRPGGAANKRRGEGKESEDEEEGRARLGKRKRGADGGSNGAGPVGVKHVESGGEELDEQNEEGRDNSTARATQPAVAEASEKAVKKRPGSYLDQILADRASKKKKKKRKKKSEEESKTE